MNTTNDRVRAFQARLAAMSTPVAPTFAPNEPAPPARPTSISSQKPARVEAEHDDKLAEIYAMFGDSSPAPARAESTPLPPHLTAPPGPPTTYASSHHSKTSTESVTTEPPPDPNPPIQMRPAPHDVDGRSELPVPSKASEIPESAIFTSFKPISGEPRSTWASPSTPTDSPRLHSCSSSYHIPRIRISSFGSKNHSSCIYCLRRRRGDARAPPSPRAGRTVHRQARDGPGGLCAPSDRARGRDPRSFRQDREPEATSRMDASRRDDW